MTQNELTLRMRTQEMIWVPVEEIDPHPLNYRTHPERQRRALRGAADDLGWAGGALTACPKGIDIT